jgi:prepilin-type N-terminal cleavage/methylation domain-containing protein
MKQRGFTLTELLVTVVIIGVIAGIASVPLMQFFAKTKLKNDAIAVGQILQEAQNHARSKSVDVQVIFSSSSVTVEREDTSEELNSFQFSDGVKYDTSNSGLATIVFDFKGSPMGSTYGDDATTFTNANGKIVICYTDNNGNCVTSKTLYVKPLTGAVRED